MNIGLIQTSLNSEIAWPKSSSDLQMNEDESNRIWHEIKSGFYNFRALPVSKRPKIVLLPEFSLDEHHEKAISELSKALGCVIIGGKDFVRQEYNGTKYVQNKAVVVIPQNWPENSSARSVSKFYFGKSFFSKDEEEAFRKKGYTSISCPHIYILNAGDYGKIGVAICADFFDIERFVIYKGRIHHLFIIAYNKDIQSFYFLAEAISRLVFCNVIICNTGHYGGSIGFSPYNELHKRYVYKHEGSKLFTTQVISLPVNSLDIAQKGRDSKEIFKSTPPKYEQKTF
ncbi:hypothetical protein [uncultured Proteiniphilum sp.]|uniref:hypothetical protein n=1 Tax=uncultured Proteiniphilum sp. TaxID=497637 RepID=UPI00261014CB|nr:hypothetical protein [uncultured Proteiniphilum sp.]